MLNLDLSFAQDPNTLTLALMLGIVPAVLWCFFWLKERDERPVKSATFAYVFAAGMLAVVVALPLERLVGFASSDPYIVTMLWAVTEEVLKFSVVLLAIRMGARTERPIDFALYAVMVGLGFAGLENALYFLGPLRSGATATLALAGSTRFIGSTLMHAIASSVAGMGIGFALYRPQRDKRTAALVGLVFAAGIHSAYNIWIVRRGGADSFGVFLFLWIAATALLAVFEKLRQAGDVSHSGEARSAPIKALERSAKEFYLSLGASPFDERSMAGMLDAKALAPEAPERAKLAQLLSELRAAYAAYLASEGAAASDAERATLTVIPDTISPKAAEGVMGVLIRAAEGEAVSA